MRHRPANFISLLVWVAAAAPASAELPLTGFELRGGDSWTTPSEEQAFIEALDGESDRVSVLEIGRTLEGRPLQLLVVGVVVVSSRAGTRSLRLRFSRAGVRRLQRLRLPRLTVHAIVRAEEGDVRTLKRAVRIS